MILAVIALLIGTMILGAGIYYLIKEKENVENIIASKYNWGERNRCY